MGATKRLLTWIEWVREADVVSWRTAGCSIDDLPDAPWYDWFLDGVSPARAARRAVRFAEAA